MQTVSSASSTCFEVAVGRRVHGDGLDAELAAGAQDAQRDLAAVGDDDFVEHAVARCSCSFDDEQRLPELDGIAVLDQDRDDAAGLVGFDLVHHLHRLDDAEHVARLDLAAQLRRSDLAPGAEPSRRCRPLAPSRPCRASAPGPLRSAAGPGRVQQAAEAAYSGAAHTSAPRSVGIAVRGVVG